MSRRNAFSLIELLIVIAIVALLISILLPAVAGARRAGRAAVCTGNLRQFGTAYYAYATENRGAIAALTGDPAIGMVGDSGCAIQAMRIIANNDDRGPSAGPNRLPQFPSSGSGYGSPTVYVFEQFSYLPLLDHMGGKLRVPVFVCPEDRARLSWQREPLGMAASAFKPIKSINTGANLAWWPYSSSYQVTPANIARDSAAPGEHALVYGQASTHDLYQITKIHRGNNASTTPLFGRRKIEEVTHTAQKVVVMDSQHRHEGKRELFYAYEQARQPLLFWDGSIAHKQTKDANVGWHPTSPDWLAGITQMEYEPDPGFESSNPNPTDLLGKTKYKGYYRWTRGGLRGIDFGGNEPTRF